MWRNNNGSYGSIYHGGPGFKEPVKAELWWIADALAQLVVNALLVKAQFVKHADEEAVLLLRVVLAFVGAIGDTELMEGSLVTTDLQQEKQHQKETKNWCCDLKSRAADGH